VVAWLLLNGGAVFVASALALAGRAHPRASRRVLATLGGYLVLVHTLVLAAGLLGVLSAASLAVPLAAAAGVGLWLVRRRAGAAEPRREDSRLSAGALFPPLAAVATAIVWTWPHVVQATRLSIWDDYVYHMVYPTLWLRDQLIATPAPSQTFTMQAWYPLSASVVAAWLMAPFQGSRGDALAWVSLTGPLYAGLVAVGAAELLARLGCRPGTWGIPVVLLLTSSRVAGMASSFSDADLAHAAALFAAFVFAVPQRELEREGELDTDAWYAALLSGFALGVKVSAALPALVVLGMVASRALAQPSRSRAAAVTRVVVVFVVAWAATAGYWYARNFLATGNPVYPGALFGWAGTTFPETTLREYAAHYGLRRTLVDALGVYTTWPVAHALLAALGLVGLAAWRGWPRRALARASRYFAAGALTITAAVLIVLPVMPYSAGNAWTFRAGVVHWESLRYVALLPILGWVALAFLVDRLGRWSAPVAVVVVAIALLASGAPLVSSPALPLALAACAVVAARWRALSSWRPPPLLQWAPVAMVVVGMLGWHGWKAAATAAAIYDEPLYGSVARILDEQPPGTRVAIFGDQWVYPAFGAQDQLVPARLDADGRVPNQPIGAEMRPGDLTVDAPTFRANLAASGIRVVVVAHLSHPGRSPDWPTQDAALQTLPDARLLFHDVSAAVWRLGP
jgi:hypothetical protein